MYYIYPEMESYEGSRDRSIEFASFYRILRRFSAFCVVLVSPFASLPIQGQFGSCPVQIFRQSDLNSKLNFFQIPVVITKLSIYDHKSTVLYRKRGRRELSSALIFIHLFHK